MTFINRNTKVFLDVNDKKELTSIRSEGRLKNYFSSLDARAWCDIIEDRRQHILEYQSKGRTGLCPGSLIPIEKLIKILTAGTEAGADDLKKLEYYEELIKIYDSLLTPEQRAKFALLKKALDAKYGMGETSGTEEIGENIKDDICRGPCATEEPTPTPAKSKAPEKVPTPANKGSKRSSVSSDDCDDKFVRKTSASAVNKGAKRVSITSDNKGASKAPVPTTNKVPEKDPVSNDNKGAEDNNVKTDPQSPKKGVCKGPCSFEECKCLEHKGKNTPYICKGPCSLD